MNGIPNLLRPPKLKNVVTGLLGKVAGQAFAKLFPGPTWGITTPDFYRDAVKVDSIVALSMQRSSNVSDYKIESGSFVSYNKVRTPTVVQVRVTRGGTESDRKELLVWLRDNVGTPTLYGVLMPEGGFKNMTLVSYTIDRGATSGLGMLIVDCTFQEIRELVPIYSGGTVSGAENSPAVPARRVQTSPSSYGGGFTQ